MSEENASFAFIRPLQMLLLAAMSPSYSPLTSISSTLIRAIAFDYLEMPYYVQTMLMLLDEALNCLHLQPLDYRVA